MKIAHLICVFKPYKGGMGNVAEQYASITAKNGHKLTIITPDYGQADFLFEKNNSDNFDILRLKPILSFGNAASLPQLIWKLRQFDVVHFHYPFYGAILPVIIASLFKNKGSKLIVHYHMDSIGTGIKGLIFNVNRRLLWPLLFKRADFITAASLDYVKNSQIADSFAKCPEKFRQIPFGVDTNAFSYSTPNKNLKNILFVGGLDQAHYFKGVSVLLKALNIIRSERKFDAQLTIVGSGDLKYQYEAQAKALGIGAYVHFTGKVTDELLAANYKNASVLVLPSINQGEAFGLVLLEAMASGRPVVASNLPGVRGVFVSPSEGMLVEPGNENDLADKLLAILSDDNLIEKMGQAARQKTESTYSLNAIAKLLEAVYAE